jgi:hypothetical protein
MQSHRYTLAMNLDMDTSNVCYAILCTRTVMPHICFIIVPSRYPTIILYSNTIKQLINLDCMSVNVLNNNTPHQIT